MCQSLTQVQVASICQAALYALAIRVWEFYFELVWNAPGGMYRVLRLCWTCDRHAFRQSYRTRLVGSGLAIYEGAPDTELS